MMYAICIVVLFAVQTYAQDAPPRHPYVQCKIDLYDCIRLDKKDNAQCLIDYKDCMAVLVPTVPPKITQCNKDLKACMAANTGLWGKAKCLATYTKCLIPTEHPYFKCKIDLGNCLKEGSIGKVQCGKNYVTCMKQLFPTLPPNMSQCNEELSTCISESDEFLDMAQCSVDYGRCLKKDQGSP